MRSRLRSTMPRKTFTTKAKYFCAEQLQVLARHGMAILGGRAFFEMDEMARYFREAPFSMYAGGTSEIQKRIIARAMGLGDDYSRVGDG